MINADMSKEDKRRAAEALAKAARLAAEALAAKEQADKEAAVLRTGRGLTDGGTG